jgi:hypothetical protein
VSVLEKAFAQHLIDHAGVGAEVADRIYFQVAPSQAARPYITYQWISGDHVHHLGGASKVGRSVLQVNAWSDVMEDALATAEAVRDALDGYTGTLGSGGNTATVQRCHLGSEFDDFVAPIDGGLRPLFARRQTWEIDFAESLPAL